MSDPKAAARSAVERHHRALVDLSHRVHAHNELKWEEERSSAAVAEALAERGFATRAGICDLPTAFEARAGSGPLEVVVCAEYDALPGIGHACGHNVIAAMAVGAGVALAEVADDIGITVRVMGTPAEEGGAGKIVMLGAGAFSGAHLAVMAHPAPYDVACPPMIAAQQFAVRYQGKEAHASAYPEFGVNAADALTVAQVALALLRQHTEAGQQVHGIVTHGGDAPNIVPARTEAEYMVRGRTLESFGAMYGKVMRCFEAGALAAGATLDVVTRHVPYAEVSHDAEVAACYRRNAEALGRVFPAIERRPGGSTDMGNVSAVIPAIHPLIGIDSLPAVNHQPEFSAHAVRPAADAAIADGAAALAWTVIDCATDPAVRTRLLGAPG